MDGAILNLLNGLATNDFLSTLLDIVTRQAVKTLPPMALIWSIWFLTASSEERRDTREKLLTTIVLALIAVAVGRALALSLPFRARPIFDPDSNVVLLDWVDPEILNGWSSFPSDHAVLFFALAVGILFSNRLAGYIALAHAAVIVCIPRIAVGWHWPSDILVGAAVGAILVCVLFKPIKALIHKTNIVPYFETREYLGYPLLFLITYEIASLFRNVTGFLSVLTG